MPITNLIPGQPFEITDRNASLSGLFADGSPFEFPLYSFPYTYPFEPEGFDPDALLTVTSVLHGDYNGDGAIDAADYVAWRSGMGSTADLNADGNGDGRIDAGDYNVWRSRFGQGAARIERLPHDGAVPEPTAVFIVLAALLSVLFALVAGPDGEPRHELYLTSTRWSALDHCENKPTCDKHQRRARWLRYWRRDLRRNVNRRSIAKVSLKRHVTGLAEARRQAFVVSRVADEDDAAMQARIAFGRLERLARDGDRSQVTVHVGGPHAVGVLVAGRVAQPGSLQSRMERHLPVSVDHKIREDLETVEAVAEEDFGRRFDRGIALSRDEPKLPASSLHPHHLVGNGGNARSLNSS